MKNKKLFFLIVFITILIIITMIFLFLYYKNKKNGNNIINKSEEEIINDILNIKCFSAKLDITIKTNKNETKYIVKQKIYDGKAIQEIEEPQNIAGVITEFDGEKLKIINNKLNLETTFDNYQYIVENRLWLDSFIEEYKNNNSNNKESKGNEIILETKNNDKPYNVIKKLYINKEDGKPTKMVIQDINKKTLVYILYIEIDIS